LVLTHCDRTPRGQKTECERLRQIDKKVEQLFVLWSKHIDWLLDEARRVKNRTANRTDITSKILLLNDKNVVE
jgi:hypothetical protein